MSEYRRILQDSETLLIIGRIAVRGNTKLAKQRVSSLRTELGEDSRSLERGVETLYKTRAFSGTNLSEGHRLLVHRDTEGKPVPIPSRSEFKHKVDRSEISQLSSVLASIWAEKWSTLDERAIAGAESTVVTLLLALRQYQGLE